MEGIIFNIQKFSIHDGPGIRTTVFFKGCPLRCEWCANPESQAVNPQVLYNNEKCLQCETCVHTCPKGAIKMEDGLIRIDHKTCDHCMECVKACPGKALTQEGEIKTVEEVVDICMQDIDFYEESNGGVTLSGGEAMVQYDFMMALVHALKEKGLHLAIETTGIVDHEKFKKAAPLFDLLLFDVKQADPMKHKKGTHVTNEVIQKNFKWAIEQGLNVLPRIPVIPGFNETLEDAKELATCIKDAGAKDVQLLPFHQFGENKYKLLGKDYKLHEVEALHPEDLVAYQNEFIKCGLNCFF